MKVTICLKSMLDKPLVIHNLVSISIDDKILQAEKLKSFPLNLKKIYMFSGENDFLVVDGNDVLYILISKE